MQINAVVIPGELEPPAMPLINETSAFRMDDGTYTFFSSATAKVNCEDGVKVYYTLTNDPNVTEPTTGLADPYVENGGTININSEGRLLMMAVKDTGAKLLKSAVNVYEFKKSSAVPFSSIGDLIDAQNDGVEVLLNCPLNIVGAFETNAQNPTGQPTYYAYVRDANNRYIKLVSQGAPFPDSYFNVGLHPSNASHPVHGGVYLEAGSVVGEFRYNYGLPEIYVKTPTQDYTQFLAGSTSNNKPRDFSELQYSGSDKIDKSMFNQFVMLDNMRWVGQNNEIEDAAGNRFQLYSRLNVPVYNSMGVPNAGQYLSFNDMVKDAEADHRYRIYAFIGQLGGELLVFPIWTLCENPALPEIMAPNQLSGEVNIISDEVSMWVNPATATEGATYYYRFDPAPDYFTHEMGVGSEAAVTFDIADIFGDKDEIKLIVWGAKQYPLCAHDTRNNKIDAASGEVELTLRRHEATVDQSIAAFKGEFLSKESTLPSVNDDPFTATEYRKFSDDSRAVVIEATPEWLYVRDAAVENPASVNYLLLHNANGWENPKIDDETKGVRPLAAGDLISGFAMIPAITSRGNLVSESTNFARTVKWQGLSQEEIAPTEFVMNYEIQDAPEGETYYRGLALGEQDRMKMVKLSHVRVKHDEGTDIYTIDAGAEGSEPELALDIFTQRIGGWRTAWAEGEYYDITGVVIKNGDNGYALAMMDYTANKGVTDAPSVFIAGSDDKTSALQEFLHTLTVEMEAPENVEIYYSTNGKDPLNDASEETRKRYTGAFEVELADGQDRVMVMAFATERGKSPSALVTRTFVKRSRELSLLLNFIDRAEKGADYHFNGTVRVVDKMDNYLMVRGIAGHYLPIYNPDGWADATIGVGDYVTDFLITPDIVGDKPYMRGANVTEGYADRFNTTLTGTDLPDIDIDNVASVSTLASVTPRRKVTLLNAHFTPSAARTDEWDINCAGDETAPMPVIADHTGADMSDVRQNVNYNVTGYVMYAADGSGLEFWPTDIETIITPSPVKVEVEATKVTGSGNEYAAEFYPLATVTLSHESPRATIYYVIDDNDTDNSTHWFEYYPGHPIVVSESCRLHIRAISAQGNPSVESHVVLTRLQPSGDVELTPVVDEENGTVTVSLKAKEQLAEGGKIYYGIGSDINMKEYTGAFTLDATSIVYAQIRGGKGMTNGKVCHELVVVPEVKDEPVTPDDPADRISGRVQFEQIKTDDGKVLIRISPEQPIAGDYKIYYTLDGTITIDDDHLYSEPGFEMPESGYVMAVLVEEGKPAGQTCEVYVWVVPAPTAIDSVGADSADSIRVEGSSIIAPEGSEVYDIAGRRVRPDSLRPGIYIVRTPAGKTIKLTVNN